MYKTLGFRRLFECFCPALAFVSADRYEARNPQRFIHVTVVFHAKERPCDKCQRTFSTFASPNSQADASACKRAKFLPTHFDSICLNNMIQENKWKRKVDF